MGWSSPSPSPSSWNQQQPLNNDEYMHKTKAIHFLGRTTPIILQNDNGPCPLLAICNVLLLRNVLNLSPDIDEVSQQKLLSLVAELLIDSNNNVNNKDAGYVENRRQNIADTIELLPRLATGIDVNIKFRRIDDFEFTPECAIFDLLDIPLYHGWIVDPQDNDSANAIGSKSYNELMEELVTHETRNTDTQHNSNLEEDSVVPAAPTTTALGVSSSLSNTRSFDDSTQPVSNQQIPRKGDLEECAELLRVLKLSEAGPTASVSNSVVGQVNGGAISVCLDGDMCSEQVLAVDSGNKLKKKIIVGNNDFHETEPPLAHDCSPSGKDSNEQISSAYILGKAANSSIKTDTINDRLQLNNKGFDESLFKNDASVGGGQVHNQSTISTSNHEAVVEPGGLDAMGLSSSLTSHTNSDLSGEIFQQTDASGALPSNVDGKEPICEGEECALNTIAYFEDSEPVDGAEALLAEQADKISFAASNLRAKGEINPQQGESIKSFLRNNASQLTFYGLFCLQDGLKERELCVFFRNNHFSTMFKFEGELYLLATDQGYLNQFDLVWEKLNEVNGDTLFMTGNFEEFKIENPENNTWDEDHAITSTVDYLASIESASDAGLHINSDLQLAIALQQQEFEQQEQQQLHASEELTTSGSHSSTGPQVARNFGRYSPPSSKPEAQPKEKCTVM